MKLICIIGFLILNIGISYAQSSYIPFVNPNKYWFYETNDGNDIPKNLAAYSIWFDEDTLISNVKYLKVYNSSLKGKHNCQFPPCFTPNFPYEFEGRGLIGYVTEDTINKRVHFLPKNKSNNECLDSLYELYDFNLKTGDSLSICHKEQINKKWNGSNDWGDIVSLENGFYYNKLRRVANFKAPATNGGLPFLSLMSLIEGVGFVYYEPFFFSQNTGFSHFCEGSLNDCNIVLKTDKVVIDPTNIFPNPTNDKFMIVGYENISRLKIFDTNGVSLDFNYFENEIDISKFAQGVYFIEIIDNNVRHLKKIVKL